MKGTLPISESLFVAVVKGVIVFSDENVQGDCFLNADANFIHLQKDSVHCDCSRIYNTASPIKNHPKISFILEERFHKFTHLL
jgi:hypothetical protein